MVLRFGASPAPALEVVCEVLLADVGLKCGQFGERFSVTSFLTVCFWFMPAGSQLCQLLNYQLLHCCGVFNVPHVTSWLPAIFVFLQHVSETHSKQNEKGKRGMGQLIIWQPRAAPPQSLLSVAGRVSAGNFNKVFIYSRAAHKKLCQHLSFLIGDNQSGNSQSNTAASVFLRSGQRLIHAGCFHTTNYISSLEPWNTTYLLFIIYVLASHYFIRRQNHLINNSCGL